MPSLSKMADLFPLLPEGQQHEETNAQHSTTTSTSTPSDKGDGTTTRIACPRTVLASSSSSSSAAAVRRRPRSKSLVDRTADAVYREVQEALPDGHVPTMPRRTPSKEDAPPADAAEEKSFFVRVVRRGWVDQCMSPAAAAEEAQIVRSARHHLYAHYGAAPSWASRADEFGNRMYLIRFAELWRAVYLVNWGKNDAALKRLLDTAPPSAQDFELLDRERHLLPRGGEEAKVKLWRRRTRIAASLDDPDAEPDGSGGGRGSNPSVLSDLTSSMADIGFYSSNSSVGDSPCPSKTASSPAGDSSYFRAYSRLAVHRMMLQDRVRTEAYSKAILGASLLFKGKVVMDVGCGTGILSLFAAKVNTK